MVGAGAFGRFCIDAYRQTRDIIVAAVVDPIASDPVPGVRWERDLDAILTDGSIEVVHLATPPYVRAALAEPSLRAGKSVFCEKPLALSLSEADRMIAVARSSGVGLGVNYVMRHHPAFTLLEALMSSSLFGRVRTVSLQNFAQSLPPGHWMWDPARSGGIFVEHGVHFFDAYGRLVGRPLRLWGGSPTARSVETTIQYDGGAVGRYYHEFAYPRSVERTAGMVFAERGRVEIDGWIPTRLHGAVAAEPAEVQGVAEAAGLDMRVVAGEAPHFDVRFGDRDEAYAAAVISGMRELIALHRDPQYHMTVTLEQARESLALALRAEQAAATRHPDQISLLSGAQAG